MDRYYYLIDKVLSNLHQSIRAEPDADPRSVLTPSVPDPKVAPGCCREYSVMSYDGERSNTPGGAGTGEGN